ncbi:hypothetical protein HRbin36_01882 [bacterium HR36]|nr:hypothetical protein HRbin36_01882 [bacterium HR36]
MRWLKFLGKWLLTGLVVGFVAWEFIRQWSHLPERAWSLEPGWTLLCGVIYMLAFLPSLLYWGWCLRHLGQPTPKLAIFRAYFVGHLGKYVPGKALVPILRAALLSQVRVQPAAAILAVFYETLTCMAAGSFLVAALLLLRVEAKDWARRLAELLGWSFFAESWPIWATAGGFSLLGLAMLLPLLPAGFNRLANWLLQRTGGADQLPGRGLDAEVLVMGLAVGVINWLLLGLSMWAALRALVPVMWSSSGWWLATFSITAAVVLGFVSMLPGGLGVREGVLAILLTQTGLSSAPEAALAAVLMRLIGLISEVIVAIGLLTPGGLKWLVKGCHLGDRRGDFSGDSSL